jgi:acetyltransferase
LKPFPGKRLAVLTNGGGLGVLAVDRLIDLGGVLAELSPDTRARLDSVLPPTWSKSNPIDIIGDADAARYAAALEALVEDKANDAVLVLNVPTALASAEATAGAVVQVVRARRAAIVQPKPALAVWVGGDAGVAQTCRRHSRSPNDGRGAGHAIFERAAAVTSARCAGKGGVAG